MSETTDQNPAPEATEEQSIPDIGSYGILEGRDILVLAIIFIVVIAGYFLYDYILGPEKSTDITSVGIYSYSNIEDKEEEAGDPSETVIPSFIKASGQINTITSEANPTLDSILDNEENLNNQRRIEELLASQEQAAKEAARSVPSAIYHSAGSNAVDDSSDPLADAQNIFGESGIGDLTRLYTGSPLAAGGENNKKDNGQSSFVSLPERRHQSITATVITGLEDIVLQGTFVPFNLETAVDSSLPGFIRGSTTADVYSADGSKILIPKKSRLIGEYSSGVLQGQTRLFIIWSRLITPQGIEVPLDSPAAGPLGQSGMGGKTRTHFWKRFGGSVMLSIIGAAAQNQVDNENQRQEAANAFNDSASIALQNSINIPPTITIKHAATGFVFVARDINFKAAMDFVAAVQAKQRLISSRNPSRRESRADYIARAEALNKRLQHEEKMREIELNKMAKRRAWLDKCSYIALEKDRMLSTMVAGYLGDCNYNLAAWNVTIDGQPADYKLQESIRLTLKNQVAGLQQFLMKHYKLRLTHLGNNDYAVTNSSTDQITIQSY